MINRWLSSQAYRNHQLAKELLLQDCFMKLVGFDMGSGLDTPDEHGLLDHRALLNQR